MSRTVVIQAREDRQLSYIPSVKHEFVYSPRIAQCYCAFCAPELGTSALGIATRLLTNSWRLIISQFRSMSKYKVVSRDYSMNRSRGEHLTLVCPHGLKANSISCKKRGRH